MGFKVFIYVIIKKKIKKKSNNYNYITSKPKILYNYQPENEQIAVNKEAVNKLNNDNNIAVITNDDTSVTNISSDDNNILVIKNNDNSKMIPLTLNPNTYRLMKLMMKNK